MIPLSGRMLARDWRSGELGVLASALVIAVAIVVGISAFSDHLARSIVSESRHFLAADRVLASPRPIPDAWLEEAAQRGLRSARVVEFQSMLVAGEELQLVSVKAVTDTYPLRGALRVAAEPFAVDEETEKVPERGSVWLDARLLPLLDLAMGAVVEIGEARFSIQQIITSEPDRGATFYGMGPRVLMHWDDLPSTGMIMPGSRVDYRYLLAGDDAALNAFHQWLQPRLEASHRWLDLEDTEPRIAKALSRAEGFLLLAGALGVALAGVAVALAARRYSLRRFDDVAVMKSLGASGSRIVRLYFINVLIVCTLAAVLGGMLGFGVQAALLWLLDPFLEAPAVPPWRSLLVGAVTALVCLIAFAMPPLWRLRRVPPLRVLRRELGAEGGDRAAVVLGFIAIAGLMWWYSGSLRITATVLAGAMVATTAIGLLALLILRAGPAVGMQAGSVGRLALSGLRRRAGANALQLVVFSLAIMLLLMLALVRTSLIDEWRLQLPPETPNHFLINIAPGQVTEIEAFLAARQVDTAGLYPMVRGRLTRINDVPVQQRVSLEEDEAARVDRELNLSWAEELPEDNEVVAGHWLAKDAEGEVSVELELAERLGLKLGDRLTFQIGADRLEAEVTSIRRLNWDSMRPNFFMLLTPAQLQDYPASYISSFYLAPEEKPLLSELLRSYPTVTVLEMDAIIAQVQDIVGRVSAAMELVLALIVACGLLVLVASVRASLDVRLHESALLRALGAPRQLLLGALWLEFGLLGGVAGLLGAGAAELAMYGFQTWQLEMTFQFHAWVWVIGPALGALFIGAVGYWSCRRVVQVAPMAVLQTV